MSASSEKRIPFSEKMAQDRRSGMPGWEKNPPKHTTWSMTHKAYTGELSPFGERLRKEGKL